MATLIRWDPLREIAQMQNEFGRLLGGLTGQQGNGTTQAWVPAVDVWETEDELVYAFDLPGIPQNKISLEFDEGALTVSAERERTQEVKQERFYRFERRHGSFSRTIGVPQGVTEDAIKAEYKDGVLEIHIQKPKAPEPRRIQIGGTGEASTIETMRCSCSRAARSLSSELESDAAQIPRPSAAQAATAATAAGHERHAGLSGTTFGRSLRACSRIRSRRPGGGGGDSTP